MPTPGAWPYDVDGRQERRGLGAAASIDDRILRLDPKSGQFVEYSAAAVDERPAGVRRQLDDAGHVLGGQQSRRVDREARAAATPRRHDSRRRSSKARGFSPATAASIENSAFIVANDRFVGVGRRGELPPPPGAARVDLTGKTVMPALVDDHVHMGYRKGTSFSADNYTRENLLDMLDRYAFYGVAAILESRHRARRPAVPGARRGAFRGALSHHRQRLRHAECRARRRDARQRLWRHHRGGGAPGRARARRPASPTWSRSGSTTATAPCRSSSPTSIARSSTRRTSTTCA